MNKFTAKQLLFIDEYIISLNATEAAKKAKYSPRTAYAQGQRLLKHVEIKAEIDRRLKERADECKVDQAFVIKNLIRVVEICTQSIPVMIKVGGDFIESGYFKIDSSGANRALELLGKHLGMFKEEAKDPVFNLYQLIGKGNGNAISSDEEAEEELGKLESALFSGNGKKISRL